MLFSRVALVFALAGSALASEPSSDSTAALARELNADAATHTSLSGDGPTSGHDLGKGFLISDGGANKLYLGGNSQFRYYANWRDNPPSPDSGFANGFQYRRLRLLAQGTVIDENLSYKFEVELAGGSAQLTDAFGEYKLSSSTALKWGQFKLPLLKEELTPHTAQLTAERSITNAVFTQNYSQGVQLSYVNGDIKLAGAFSDGLNTFNTDFAATSNEADYAFTGRLDYKWAGDWKQNDQATSFRNANYAGFLGAALHYQNGGSTAMPVSSTPSSTIDKGVFQYTADVGVKGNGWNLFGAFVGRNTEDRPADQSFNDFGLVVQGGLFVCDPAELFLRYDEVFPDSDRGATGNDFTTLTFGMNWYMVPESHVAKLTTDVCWFLDAQSDSSSLVKPSTNYGLLPSTEDNQVTLRVQFQIIF